MLRVVQIEGERERSRKHECNTGAPASPRFYVPRSHIMMMIMEEKRRYRTISKGSLDDCLITEANELIRSSSVQVNQSHANASTPAGNGAANGATNGVDVGGMNGVDVGGEGVATSRQLLSQDAGSHSPISSKTALPSNDTSGTCNGMMGRGTGNGLRGKCTGQATGALRVNSFGGTDAASDALPAIVAGCTIAVEALASGASGSSCGTKAILRKQSTHSLGTLGAAIKKHTFQTSYVQLKALLKTFATGTSIFLPHSFAHPLIDHHTTFTVHIQNSY